MEDKIDESLIKFLNEKVKKYESPAFVKDDPVSIPHRFSRLQDIEIAGFFAAVFAWGNRKSIIRSADKLLGLMDHAPYDFIMNYKEKDLAAFMKFAHRTFNDIDLFHFIDFFKYHYRTLKNQSLETAFTQYLEPGHENVEEALTGFYYYFFNTEIFQNFSERTRKHIATPAKKSACKRINMYLRWMVRSNRHGVDFGLWKHISPAQLVCPLDLHVARVARNFKLLHRPVNDWQAAVELTRNLKLLDARDPVKYDYALFGLGVIEKF